MTPETFSTANRTASTNSAPAPAAATTAGTASFGWAEAEAWPGNDDRQVEVTWSCFYCSDENFEKKLSFVWITWIFRWR